MGKCKRYISILKILFKNNLPFITNIVRFIIYRSRKVWQTARDAPQRKATRKKQLPQGRGRKLWAGPGWTRCPGAGGHPWGPQDFLEAKVSKGPFGLAT